MAGCQDTMLATGDPCREKQFNPIGAADAQVLCNRLKVNCFKDQSVLSTVTGELGAPCKNIPIKGDGNCFFRAVSEAVCGTDEFHRTIRNVVVEQLQSNDVIYTSMLRSGYRSVSDYITKSQMASLGTWATEVEIQAAADCLGVSIYTYYTGRWLIHRCNGVKVSNQGIYLENVGNHFETVVCVQRQQMLSCYGYCKVDRGRTSVTPLRDECSASLWSDFESARLSPSSSYYNDWTCEEHHGDPIEDNGNVYETLGDNVDNTMLQEAEPHDQYLSNNSPVDDQMFYGADSCENGCTQQTFNPSDSDRCDSEIDWEGSMMYPFEYETLGDQLEDTRLQETEPGDQYESNNSPVDDQHLYDSDACGNSFRQHTFSPADSNRSVSETDCQATMAGDYNDWTYEHEHDTLSDTVEDTRSQEEDTPAQYGSNTRHVDRDNVYKEAVEDYFDVDDDDVEDMVRAEEDAKKHQQIDLMLKWSILNRTWHSFLEWLGARWWGSVSADQISSFMGGRKIRFGDIVIAAHFGDMPGGVCSVTAKTQNEVLTFHVAICGGRYICKDLVEGDFSTPIDIIRHLVDKLGEGRILRQHWTIPHNPDYFSVTHIAGQMCYMMKVLKDSWWGASYGNEVWSPHYREVIEHLRKKGPMYENPAAAIHYMDDVSLGYLFDIVTAFGNRFKVTFDTFGFTVGTRAHFSDIAGVLSYISRIDRVTFVSPPCSLMHADQSLGDVDYIANPQRVVHSRATCNVLQL